MIKQKVLFLGSVNSMPMMYALVLKKRGYDVKYLVSESKSGSIDRPENIFHFVKLPYPPWIKETSIAHKFLVSLFPFFYYLKLKFFVFRGVSPDIVFFNDTFVSLARYYPKARKIFLTHGGDLDSWSNLDAIKGIAIQFSKKKILRLVPYCLVEVAIGKIVNRMFLGASLCQDVLYFPLSFDSEGEKVVRQLELKGVRYVPRFDISLDAVGDFDKRRQHCEQPHRSRDRLVVVSAVRFAFKTFPQGNRNYNKGNDLIIKGLKAAVNSGVDMEIHFFRKGVDLSLAYELVDELGLSHLVVWHDELPLDDLLNLYARADVCFDSVGQHWLGAVGCYALYLGKPLIANVEDLVEASIIPKENPILHASTVEEICNNILYVSQGNFNQYDGAGFAKKYFTPDRALKKLRLL